ncbi:hypothetical protein LTR84_004747 [Exophiala bonariae]|uniref:Heterokaryon incompatibility domain-containing protein n=1 Tax=Exophiala bonariae TaxID=1690606 RepID=A0AAV9NRB7_9EURO|nr:hypothetical protein LTR84_004747 [Exophiala bonariae]
MTAGIPSGYQFLWSRHPQQPYLIVFRVVAEFPVVRDSTPGFDAHGNLTSRDPGIPLDSYVAEQHLRYRRSWPGTAQQFNSPFISCSKSYKSALRRKDWLLREGAVRVVILAYDVSKETTILDARKLAIGFRLRDPHLYKNEVLLWSKIAADDYSLLAVMHATSGWVTELLTDHGTITVPSDYWSEYGDSENPLHALRNELYHHTGWKNDDRLLWLVQAMMA